MENAGILSRIGGRLWGARKSKTFAFMICDGPLALANPKEIFKSTDNVVLLDEAGT